MILAPIIVSMVLTAVVGIQWTVIRKLKRDLTSIQGLI